MFIMGKKIVCLLLAVCLLFLCGCSGGSPTLDIDDGFASSLISRVEDVIVYETNPLTGKKNLTPEKVDLRPVAVSVNNAVESVQTSLTNADIIYETEVEGGTTRLLAVFKDISIAGQVGPVRSARIPFNDLACGHDALFLHCGVDPVYCAAHFKNIGSDHMDINTGLAAKYGFREPNGFAYEHTMYTNADKIKKGMEELEKRTTTEKNTWISFLPEPEEGTPVVAATTAKDVKVVFNGGYADSFKYNADVGVYQRIRNGSFHTDYKTGARVSVKNIFVLKTTIRNYPDGVHREVLLNSGSGYYISDGKYEEIKWAKGDYDDPLTFTKADGSAFSANAGNSWICIINSSGRVDFTAAPPPATSSTAAE